jgi:hypothetical protein
LPWAPSWLIRSDVEPGTRRRNADQAPSESDDEEGDEQEGPKWDKVRQRFVGRRSVSLTSVQTDLDDIQNQARRLLTSLSGGQIGDMRLDEVQFSVGVSAQGSLGIVTAGAQAAIALKYKRVDGKAGKSEDNKPG